MTPAQARKIALSFPGAQERISQGSAAVYVGDELLVRLGTREPGTLLLRTQTTDERDMMIQAEPALFYITDHFRTYKGLLARLSMLDTKTLRALLTQRMRAIDTKKPKTRRK